MTDFQTEDRLLFKDAKVLADNISALSDHQLQQCWHSYAGYISYLNADDYGDDWKKVGALRPKFAELKAEIEKRGLPSPSGNYLL